MKGKQQQFLTTGEIAEQLNVATWLVRRAIDELGEQRGVTIRRAGLYRLFPASLLDQLRETIARHSRRQGQRQEEPTRA